MNLPRRYFSTASSHTTEDILRSTEDLLSRAIDDNDVVGADVVKDVVMQQAALTTRLNAVEGTLLTLGGSSDVGTMVDFNTAFNTASS